MDSPSSLGDETAIGHVRSECQIEFRTMASRKALKNGSLHGLLDPWLDLCQTRGCRTTELSQQDTECRLGSIYYNGDPWQVDAKVMQNPARTRLQAHYARSRLATLAIGFSLNHRESLGRGAVPSLHSTVSQVSVVPLDLDRFTAPAANDGLVQ